MGAYNTLTINVQCKACGFNYVSALQFKAGEVRQHHYIINDHIRSNDNDDVIRNRKVMAYGILENEKCPNCGDNHPEDYDIFIDRGMIKRYQVTRDMTRYLPPNDDAYYIVEE
jgi:hypothetical protein